MIGSRGSRDVAGREAHAHSKIVAGGHLISADVIIDEEKAVIAQAAHGNTRHAEIGGIGGKFSRGMDDHRREIGSKLIQKIMEEFQLPVRFAFFAVLADRRLKIVRNFGRSLDAPVACDSCRVVSLPGGFAPP